jgi:hypothetical protein
MKLMKPMTEEMKVMKPTTYAAALLAITAACNGNDDAHGSGGAPTVSLDAEACEHMTEGPFIDVTAGASASAAPDVSAEHTSHRIALVAHGAAGGGGGGGSGGGGGGGTAASPRGGYVSLAVPNAGDVVLFVDADVPLSVQDATGSDVAVEDSCDPSACSTDCDLLKGRHTVELGVGTYALRFGPTDIASVALVHEAHAH